MGMGLQGAYAGGALHDELLRVMAERQKAELLAQQQQQQQFQNSITTRDQALQEEIAHRPPAPERPMTMGPGQSLVEPSSGRILTSIPDKPEKPAAPERPITMAPGGSLVDPSTGRIITSIPDRPEKPVKDTYGEWQKQYDYELAHPKSNAAAGGTQGLQRARAESAITMLDRLKEVHGKLQTGEGPGQLMKGFGEKVKGALNMQNAATEYQKLRKATAVALAVAIQGSRPSDADAEAMSQLLPDFNTPAEVAGNLFSGVNTQLQQTMQSMGGTGVPKIQNPGGSGVPQEFDFDPKTGTLTPRKR